MSASITATDIIKSTSTVKGRVRGIKAANSARVGAPKITVQNRRYNIQRNLSGLKASLQFRFMNDG